MFFKREGNNVQKAQDFRQPLTMIVHDDLTESLKRVEQINFLPEHIEIKLISGEVTVRGTIMVLGVIIHGVCNGLPYFWLVNMPEEYKTRVIDYDEQTATIIIHVIGATELTFTCGKEKRSFCKPKSDL